MSAAGGRRVSAVAAALGVLRVVNAGMERALRVVSVERGHDPRSCALVTFGGAGALHAVELARALRIPRVVVPADPGALSALGALQSDVVKDLSRTVMLDAADPKTTARLERAFSEMEREARAALRREGFAEGGQRHERTLTARYKGQSFELEVEWSGGGAAAALVARFQRAHEARYGYATAGRPVEIVSARVRSRGLVEGPRAVRPARRRASVKTVEPHAVALVHFETGRKESAVYSRAELPAGARLRSPCVVTEYSSTTLVPPGARSFVDGRGNLIIEP
jgi:N-methylhydantoinase A